jgi:hypothetical protein
MSSSIQRPDRPESASPFTQNSNWHSASCTCNIVRSVTKKNCYRKNDNKHKTRDTETSVTFIVIYKYIKECQWGWDSSVTVVIMLQSG